MIDNYSIFNEKTLFLPAGINGMGSLVDVEMLSKYGFDISNKDFTWDDLFELAAKVQADDPTNYLCCVDSKQAALYYARVYLRQLTGRQLINDDGTMGCSREELAKAFELVDRCYKEKVFQPIQESAVYNNTMTQICQVLFKRNSGHRKAQLRTLGRGLSCAVVRLRRRFGPGPASPGCRLFPPTRGKGSLRWRAGRGRRSRKLP